MSFLSEKAFSVSWIGGLEFALWNALSGNIKEYGRLIINAEVLEALQQLSNKANGWIYFDEDREETYISFTDWKSKLKEGHIH